MKSKIILSLIILIFFFSIFFLIKDFQQLPSPIFGGDYYHQLGQVYHILEGGYWFGSYNLLNSLPGYLPFFPVYVALIAKITSLTAMKALIYSSLVSLIISIIFIYLFLKRVIGDEIIPLLLIVIFFPIARLLILKYGIFTQLVLMPLFLIFLYDFFNNNTKMLPLAITYGVLGISHPVAFIIATLFLIIFALYFRQVSLKQIFIVIFIGVIIAQLYWFEPVFSYKLKSANNYLEWNNENFSSVSFQFVYLKNVLKNYFFDYSSSLMTALSSLFSFLGLIFLFLAKKNNYGTKFLFIFNISSFIILFHYFLARPLLGLDFYPVRINDLLFSYNAVILAGFSLKFLFSKIKVQREKIIIALTIVLLIVSVYNFSDEKENNAWYKTAREGLPDNFLQLQKFVLENTNVNDVFISTNELSFALNALTGRKVINTRRAQNSPYFDMDERNLASAIILYGNNSEARRSLINELKVKYLFWEEYWIPSEYSYENGQIKSFDPLTLFYSENKKKTLQKYNISYYTENTWVDPAMKGNDFKKFDLIFIVPNYRIPEKPWNSDLDNYLEEIFNYQNKTRVYKVKINNP